MDYIGSKAKLNNWIFSIIDNVCYNKNSITFLDACAGTGSVSKFAANQGYNVISNDIMSFPKVITNGSVSLNNNQINKSLEYIKYLNSLNGIDGFFSKNYAGNRLYFTQENAKLIDNIRLEIGKIDDLKVRDYLLYCGLEAMSRVSNTAGVHGAFLKKIKNRANDRIIIRPEPISNGKIISYTSDILKLLNNNDFREKYKEDILYIDPPYNTRQYGPNYHLYETFILYDNPTLTGKTGLRNKWQDESGSSFCSKTKCLKFLIDVINSSTAKYVFLSYSTDGILKENDIFNIFKDKVTIFSKEYKRYKSDSSGARKYSEKSLYELLFQIKLY